MATLSFGNFPVDMTDPDLFTDKFIGEPELFDFSSSFFSVIFPDGTIVTLTGNFDFSSLQNFLNNSFFSGILATDPADDLIFSLTGLPSISFREISELSSEQIVAIVSSIPLTVNGSPFNDHLIVERATGINTLNGNDGEDQLDGNLGNDILNGGIGNDILLGMAGNDTLNGGEDADQLIGGAGIDTAAYVTSAAGVSVNLAAGSGAGGEATGDTLQGIENITGSDHEDHLDGDDRVNVLAGGAGNDFLNGGSGNDRLLGGQAMTAIRWTRSRMW
jgi:RTX toxins and related Ca2+-binding proteins